MKAHQGRLPVLGETPILPGLDHHHAGLGNTMIFQAQEPLFIQVRQGRGPDIKTQMDGGRSLVYVLASRTLRPHGTDLDFTFRDGELV